MEFAHKNTEFTRNLAIKKEFDAGISGTVLGKRYGISRQRISQIVHNLKEPLRAARKFVYVTGRTTCYICRARLLPVENKYCTDCVRINNLDHGGRDLTRGLVRGRDDNTCQACGKKWEGRGKYGGNKRFDVHHLHGECGKKSRKYDKISEMHGLITVCHKCHYNLHDHAEYGNDGNFYKDS